MSENTEKKLRKLLKNELRAEFNGAIKELDFLNRLKVAFRIVVLKRFYL